MVKRTAVVRHVATLVRALRNFAQFHLHCRVRAGITCRREVRQDVSSPRGGSSQHSGFLHTASHELASSWPAATVRLNSPERKPELSDTQTAVQEEVRAAQVASHQALSTRLASARL